jgi:2-methylcitrate dehydratase
MAAVALLDDRVMPEQYSPERIERTDVQTLLRKVTVRPLKEYSRRFPDEMPCRITVTLQDGHTLMTEKTDYEGFLTRPMRWETVVEKFEQLTEPYILAAARHDIVKAIAHLERAQVAYLMQLLAHAWQAYQSAIRQEVQHDAIIHAR